MSWVVTAAIRRTIVPVFFATLAVGSLAGRAGTFTVTNANDFGDGSLRAAVSNANTIAGVDLINFDIPGAGPFTINLASNLQSILEPVIIDGTTQPGYAGRPLVELDGASAAGNGTGIWLLTSNCVIKGLAINRFARDGIRIEIFGGNTVQANFIGTGPFGTNSLGNGNGGSSGFGGVTILSEGNLIGGLNGGEGNLISGSNRWGIYLKDPPAANNQIKGNFVGVDVSGTNRLGNGNDGIAVSGASANFIGPSNVISGNAASGVYLNPGANSNWVFGNLIGTDYKGAKSVSNVTDGVTIYGAMGNLIGGTNTAQRNLISGNGGRGVIITASGGTGNVIQGNYIGTDTNGAAKIGNAFSGVEILNTSGNTVGGIIPGARNVISGNGLSGVSINDSAATANVVAGNFIGTDASGSNVLGNARSGVFISGVIGNLIGGTNAGARNVISGNTENGVLVTDYHAGSNVVQGNYIGTDLNGTRRLGNGMSGVRLEAPANTVGGTTVFARNIISANTNSAIFILGVSASNNIVQGNYLGTDVSGAVILGDKIAGVGINSAPGNLIGGTIPGARNLMAGNDQYGVYITAITATRNQIQGNYIGTDATGMTALANGYYWLTNTTINVASGIDISAAPANLIGGTSAGAGNLISGNWRDAIAIGDVGASNNVIQGNRIGTTADGASPLGNEWHGVEMRDTGGGANTVIGGAEPGAGNVLAYATLGQRSGVRIRPVTGTGGNHTNILVRGNSIFFNGGSGANGFAIDIGNFGLNGNDGCDGDDGPNHLQNYPVLTNAQSAGTTTRLSGTLNSSANTTFLLQFYANPVAEPSGQIEGKVFLGDTFVTTDGSCNAAFSALLTNGLPAGQYVTVTATDPANNTSEFSPAATVVAAQLPGITTQPQSQVAPYGTNVTFSVVAFGTAPLTYQWRFNGSNVANATASSLTVSNVHVANAGNYSVMVSNPFGSTNSSTATLTVQVSQPTISVNLNGSGQLQISWPAGGPDFTLQETPGLTPPIIWTNSAAGSVETNGQRVATITPTAGNRFYRLAVP